MPHSTRRLWRLDRRAPLTLNPGNVTGHHHFLRQSCASEDRTCSCEDMIADKHTHTHTHRQTDTLITILRCPIWSGVTMRVANSETKLPTRAVQYAAASIGSAADAVGAINSSTRRSQTDTTCHGPVAATDACRMSVSVCLSCSVCVCDACKLDGSKASIARSLSGWVGMVRVLGWIRPVSWGSGWVWSSISAPHA